MPAVIVDASVTSAWCFPDEETVYTREVLRAVSSTFDAIAPRLWAYEVRNVVLTGLRRSRITQTGADDFLRSLAGLSFSLTDPLSYDSLFTLANRYKLSVYDAAYLDLVIREGQPIASLDGDLMKAAKQCGIAMFRT